jgi:Na+/alanine symporter
MTIPNLIGIFLLRKDMKKSIAEYKIHLDKNFKTRI